MKIQAFICNWRGQCDRAVALEKRIGRLAATTVINTEASMYGRDGWVDLDDSAYFAEQWNKAVSLFDADILFHIQADADMDDFEPVFDRARDLFTRRPVGVYEPNVDYTSLFYDRTKLFLVEPDLFRVAVTDCTCWFIHGDVVRRFQPIDLSLNTFGWGVPTVIAALSYGNGRICVRDYRFNVVHPKGRGYQSDLAKSQRNAYIESLDPPLRAHVDLLVAEFRRTKGSPL